MPVTAEAQRTIKDAAEEFLARHRIAVTGVSRSPKDHGAHVASAECGSTVVRDGAASTPAPSSSHATRE